MAKEGIATLPMQDMPAESQGIGAFNPEAQPTPDITEKDRFDAVIAALSQKDPQLVAKVQQFIQEINLSPEETEQLKQVVAYIEQNKEKYPEVRQYLIDQDIFEADELPEQYSEEFMVLLKMAAYGSELMKGAQPQKFRKGGLAQAAESLRQKGRYGDSVLAHINPKEAALLKRMGGSGTINPKTGLPEFGMFSFVRKAVGKVVGVADKVFGSEITNVIASVGGFMIGGPAGAAAAQAALTYGRGGSLKDIAINAATAYVGAQYGPQWGAAASGGATLLRGGSLKDAIKSAAIAGATSWAMQNAGETIGQGLQSAGEWMNGTTPNTDLTSVAPTTPTTATDIAQQGGANTDFGLKAGPAPTPTSPMAPRIMGQDMGPVNYGMTGNVGGAPAPAVPLGSGSPLTTAARVGTSADPSLSGIGSKIMGGEFGSAVSELGDYAVKYPGRTAMLGLGAATLAGGFKPDQPAPPGIVDRRTGTDFINADPRKYVVQNIPGVKYTPEGNIDYSSTAPKQKGPYNTVVQTPQFGNINIPRTPYLVDPNNPFATQPIQGYRSGGISQVYPRRTGPISGPGTGTSDSIPAMLSDGEFVITAKAVRGIGNGSRREGAKKLYRMMHAMEKKAGGKV